MNQEQRLQHEIVKDFVNKFPLDRKCLWSTRNNTFSAKDGMTQRAIGMIAGVSDLCFFGDGRFIGIEIKCKGSRHSVEHLRQQLEWGQRVVCEKGEWYIVTSVEGFWAVINEENHPDKLNTKDVDNLLYKSGKTVVF